MRRMDENNLKLILIRFYIFRRYFNTITCLTLKKIKHRHKNYIFFSLFNKMHRRVSYFESTTYFFKKLLLAAFYFIDNTVNFNISDIFDI